MFKNPLPLIKVKMKTLCCKTSIHTTFSSEEKVDQKNCILAVAGKKSWIWL